MWFVFLSYICFLGILYSVSGRRINKNIFLFFVFLGMFLFQGLRGEFVGIDLSVYKEVYERFGKTTFSVLKANNDFHGMEIGYVLFSKACYTLFRGSWQLFILLTSFITNFAICYFFSKETSSPAIATLAYLFIGNFIFSFSAIRQSLAISLCLFAYIALENKNILKYLLLVCLASTFHFSAFIFLIALLASKLTFSDITVFFFTLIVAFCICFSKYLMPPLVDAFFSKYSKYVNSNSSFGMFSIFMLICFCTSYYFVRKKGYVVHSSLLGMSLFAALMQSFGNVSTLTSRITFYFTPFVCVTLSEVDVSNSKSLKRWAQVLFILVLGIGVFASDLLNGYLNITPYSFFWR